MRFPAAKTKAARDPCLTGHPLWIRKGALKHHDQEALQVIGRRNAGRIQANLYPPSAWDLLAP